jgi:excinuclease ABC subunit C
LKDLAQYLDLPLVERIESFDISNTAGFESVGSMVVYEKGKPKKADYRKFKIRTIQGPDDYASMYEVLTRRFTHGQKELEERREKQLDESLGSFTKYPDLILMDGGKGQVGIALRVLSELKMNIPVCGMVKDDNHRTRGLYYDNQELPIDKSSELFKLITRIQDETHRFAIEYHRNLRQKSQVRSILDDISGIGPKRRRALMKYFQSLEAIQAAEVEEIMKVPTLNRQAAEEVYEFFHKPAVN